MGEWPPIKSEPAWPSTAYMKGAAGKLKYHKIYFPEFPPCTKCSKHYSCWMTFYQAIILITLPKRYTHSSWSQFVPEIPRLALSQARTKYVIHAAGAHLVTSIFSFILICIGTSSSVVTETVQIYLRKSHTWDFQKDLTEKFRCRWVTRCFWGSSDILCPCKTCLWSTFENLPSMFPTPLMYTYWCGCLSRKVTFQQH